MTELFEPARIRKQGQIRHFETPSGSHVIVLPTCSVPLKHLVEENWGESKNVGGVRVVRHVVELK
ncbi:MAG: hypothetical protein V1644_02965, partial [Candidatus Micrarchaeota archaeon]